LKNAGGVDQRLNDSEPKFFDVKKFSVMTFKFNGKFYEAVSGLYDYEARWYDPNSGRFLGQDPLGWASGQSRSVCETHLFPPESMTQHQRR
jgi:RHS repeat-associated protein